jgi:hypothetical protein
MTEEKDTCGNCMKFEKHPNQKGYGCCTADIPAWVADTFGHGETAAGNVTRANSTIAVTCDLFNPRKP